MALVNDLQKITEWAQANICDAVTLKKPTDSSRRQGDVYEFKTCHPRAIPMMIPSRGMDGQNEDAVPCIIISLNSFKENRATRTRIIDLNFTFIIWNPGLQKNEIFVPRGDGTYIIEKADRPQITPDNQPGWQDLFNFVDIAKRKLAQNIYLTPELRVSDEEIQFSMNDPKDLTGADYPYFTGVLALRLVGNFEPPANNFENLL